MNKSFILLLVLVYFLYSSAEKSNKKKKIMGRPFVQSNSNKLF